MKIVNIPNAIFWVKKYINSEPNKIESGISIWISVIVFITVPPIKSLNLLHSVGSSVADIPLFIRFGIYYKAYSIFHLSIKHKAYRRIYIKTQNGHSFIL